MYFFFIFTVFSSSIIHCLYSNEVSSFFTITLQEATMLRLFKKTCNIMRQPPSIIYVLQYNNFVMQIGKLKESVVLYKYVIFQDSLTHFFLKKIGLLSSFCPKVNFAFISFLQFNNMILGELSISHLIHTLLFHKLAPQSLFHEFQISFTIKIYLLSYLVMYTFL